MSEWLRILCYEQPYSVVYDTTAPYSTKNIVNISPAAAGVAFLGYLPASRWWEMPRCCSFRNALWLLLVALWLESIGEGARNLQPWGAKSARSRAVFIPQQGGGCKSPVGCHFLNPYSSGI